MTRYDKIYVPHDPQKHGVTMDDNYYLTHEGFMGPTGKPIEVVPELRVIVLSIEELKELWEAGGRNWMASGSIQPEPDFKTYLKQKGIELP